MDYNIPTVKYYNPQKIEVKWQKRWAGAKLYRAIDPSTRYARSGPKKYILIEFPYPSGEGLHVGHCRSYSALDALSRKKRMEGDNILFPIGWDAFGLPTENYALKTGIHPIEATKKNVANFKRQCQRMGFSFDWSREVNTTDPNYYKWTQWIFLQLFKRGLAYQAKIAINWCPSCKIGLANEEVVAGRCERCGTQTEKVERKQWLLKITAYADRLLDDLKKVDYLPKIKAQQINWIGRSEGATVEFPIQPRKVRPCKASSISVFTTRVDTIFGVTAVVIAPEHPLVGEILRNTSDGGRPSLRGHDSSEVRLDEVKSYVDQAKRKSEFERTEIVKEKTGVFTGLYCLNPVNNESVPVWIGDYVVATYGGGAVMVVPAHDKRDFEFAKKYKLPIKSVVEEGILVNSGQFNGLTSQEAREKITAWLVKNHFGKKTVAYKLRDWIFSRQHYWGEPIPIIHCPKCWAVPVPEKDLPVKLPYVKNYQPTGTGESPLAAVKEWVNVKCPWCGAPAKRETDTMPNWAGSNWYYLAYVVAHRLGSQIANRKSQNLRNENIFEKNKKLIDYWMPVDLYNGGMEHTTLHLLYSRFIYKVLADIKAVPGVEPYARRHSHGMVLAQDGRKMSKSFGNVINPDDIVNKFGADTLRLYEMFMGPFEQTISWSHKGVEGCWRFLNRVWRLAMDMTGPVSRKSRKVSPCEAGLKVKLHQTIKKVSNDLEKMKFNTAVAALMEFVNEWSGNSLSQADIESFIKILAPFAPHLSEELWQRMKKLTADSDLGMEEKRRVASSSEVNWSVHQQPWPKYEPKLVAEEMVTIIVQVNGKMRGEIQVKSQKLKVKSQIEELAKKEPNVAKYLEGKKIKRVVFVPGKVINFVVR